MLISYNFKQIDEKLFSLPYQDRGFRYGDGLFETIIYQKQKIRFFKDHLKRLKSGMKALGYEGVNGLKKDLLEQQILQLIHKNKLDNKVRVKLHIWRKPGGLYRPDNNHFNVLITVKEEPQYFEFKTLKLAFSKEVSLAYTPFSKFKTSNSLPYIAASIEREKRGFDDLVLCNRKGIVAECTSSNIFWVKNNRIITPSLKSGCIAGVARKNMIKKLLKAGYKVEKVMSKKSQLLEADSVFLTNVAGVMHVRSIEQHKYKLFEKAEELFG